MEAANLTRRQALATIAATLAAPALPVEPLADPRYVIDLPPEDNAAYIVFIEFRGKIVPPPTVPFYVFEAK